MGSRRKPSHIHTVAALPQSRLPLGTPTNTLPNLPRAQLLNSSFSSSSSNSPSTPQPPPNPLKTTTNTNRHTRMAVSNSSEPSQNHKSIADAKLERQRKRIEEAEAALRATSPSRARRNTLSNDQRKQAKHADLLRTSDVIGPVSEVRISSIRVVSRESSLARASSSLPQRTHDTATSETESCDGFQTIRGRRNRKDELNGRGDKPEARQSAIEATFDKRDIYEVFGNALPAPEFIEENPGTKNGQLQFIQHPNGDVSAHQWSNDRYMWENIGQFSNIRKRIEGQLASDRLKGETAHQTLQQNTLIYFRTVAKQREAQVMGLPFGSKDVQAAMPTPPTSEVPATATAIKEPAKVIPTSAVPRVQSGMAYEAIAKSSDASQIALTHSSLLPSYSQPLTPFRATESFSHTPSYLHHMARYPEDPFYSASSYQRIYGHQPQFIHGYYNPMMPKGGLSSGSYGAIAQHQLNYDFHFPPPGATSRPAVTQPSESRAEHNTSQANITAQSSAQDTTFALAGSQNPCYRTLASYITAYPSVAYEQAADNAVRPRPDTPLGNRASMSDQLWKISETAKERNLSQTNISRTVLYDPYQKNPSLSMASRTSDAEKSEDPPSVDRNLAQSYTYPVPLENTPSYCFPRTLDSRSKLAPSLRNSLSNSLQDSSPDTYWSKKPYDHSIPSVTSVSKPHATPQNFNGPFFPADKKSPSISPSAGKKTYDEELNEWWTSGNKFARQEEFYQSIACANKAKHELPTPIGAPLYTPVKHTPRSINPITTRLLVPVLENLASYVQGPSEKRRDYFCPWGPAPEWAIDRSENGNNSFYDAEWGQPPARVGRDPRYSGRLSWSAERTTPAGRYASPMKMTGQAVGYGTRIPGAIGLDRRFGVGSRF